MINLDIIVEALEMTDNETEFFFDREKSDTVMLSPYSDDYQQVSDMIDEDENDRFIYSHLQACGIINDHDKDCPCYVKINKGHPCWHSDHDGYAFDYMVFEKGSGADGAVISLSYSFGRMQEIQGQHPSETENYQGTRS